MTSKRSRTLSFAARLLIGGALISTHLAAPAALAGQQPSNPERSMQEKILVHITHGPEHPTRAALGFAVAAAAVEQGHPVSVFLAGDAVQLIRDGVLDSLSGLGTGNLRQAYEAIATGGGRFYLSGGSSAARGVIDADLEGKPAEFAGPAELVRLSLAHDRMFTY